MMRFLRLSMFVACLLACAQSNATVISFAPGLGVGLKAKLIVEKSDDFFLVPTALGLENLSTVQTAASASSTGSGLATASISNWNAGPNQAFISGSISASLGFGPGSAIASILNISTFDLLFPRRGLYEIDTIVFVDGPFEISGSSDSGFASWDLLLESPNENFGFFGQFGESQDNLCVNDIVILGFRCRTFFDFSPGISTVEIGNDLRLPITATVRFDVGVSRTVTVPEPPVLILLLGAMVWLGYCSSRGGQLGRLLK